MSVDQNELFAPENGVVALYVGARLEGEELVLTINDIERVRLDDKEALVVMMTLQTLLPELIEGYDEIMAGARQIDLGFDSPAL